MFKVIQIVYQINMFCLSLNTNRHGPWTDYNLLDNSKPSNQVLSWSSKFVKSWWKLGNKAAQYSVWRALNERYLSQWLNELCISAVVTYEWKVSTLWCSKHSNLCPFIRPLEKENSLVSYFICGSLLSFNPNCRISFIKYWYKSDNAIKAWILMLFSQPSRWAQRWLSERVRGTGWLCRFDLHGIHS